MAKKTRPISELDARMDPAVLERAREMARVESARIRLAMEREKVRGLTAAAAQGGDPGEAGEFAGGYELLEDAMALVPRESTFADVVS